MNAVHNDFTRQFLAMDKVTTKPGYMLYTTGSASDSGGLRIGLCSIPGNKPVAEMPVNLDEMNMAVSAGTLSEFFRTRLLAEFPDSADCWLDSPGGKRPS